MTEKARRRALDELYRLLDVRAQHVGGPRRLADCTGRDGWPTHGVYFFFEDGEYREDGVTPRVVRVGTHALTETSRSTLWTRLRTHRGRLAGTSPGGGNHRASIFRLHVGTALIARGGFDAAAETWGQASSAPRGIRDREVELEREVSRVIGAMPFLWLEVSDRHDRGTVEREVIGLLSNLDRPPIDPPSPQWLGHDSDRPAIRRSGLWNVQHVDRSPGAEVLTLLGRLVEQQGN